MKFEVVGTKEISVNLRLSGHQCSMLSCKLSGKKMQVDFNVFRVEIATEKRLRKRCKRKLYHWCDLNVLKIWQAIFICSMNFTLFHYFPWCTNPFKGYARYWICRDANWAINQHRSIIYLINAERSCVASHQANGNAPRHNSNFIIYEMYHFTEYC